MTKLVHSLLLKRCLFQSKFFFRSRFNFSQNVLYTHRCTQIENPVGRNVFPNKEVHDLTKFKGGPLYLGYYAFYHFSRRGVVLYPFPHITPHCTFMTGAKQGCQRKVWWKKFEPSGDSEDQCCRFLKAKRKKSFCWSFLCG